MTILNCINCGAPVHNNVCEYCGTDYREESQVETLYQEGTEDICIKLYGKKLHFYIGTINVESIWCDTGVKHYAKLSMISKNAIEDSEKDIVSL